MKKDPNISKNRTTDFKSSEQNNEISLKETSFKINGFNIIELNEDEEDNQSDLNLEDEEINNLTQKEKQSLINVSKKCENYYMNQYGETYINIPCFKCLYNSFYTNELLYFPNRKTLLNYLKYCFLFLKKNLFIDHSIYINNKYELKKCDNSYLINWKFFIEKTICKICFMEVINMKMLFGNLKIIFCDVEKETYFKELQNKGRNHNRRHVVVKNRKKHQSQKNNTVSNKVKNNALIANFYNINVSFNSDKNIIIIKKSALGNIINDLLKNKQNQNIKRKEINEKIENKSKTTINNFNIINNLSCEDFVKNKIPNFLSFNNTSHCHNLTLENIKLIIYNYTYLIIYSLKEVTSYLEKVRKEQNYPISSNEKIISTEKKLKSSLYSIWLKIIDIYNMFKYISNNVLKKMINYLIILHSDENSPKERLENMVHELIEIEQNSFKLIKLFEDNIMVIFHNCYQSLMNKLKNEKEIVNLISELSQN
jgi:hypothetical protein